MEEIISICSKEEDTILDSFCGGGSVLSACKKLNRKYIAFEINPKYYQITRQRLEVENGKKESK